MKYWLLAIGAINSASYASLVTDFKGLDIKNLQKAEKGLRDWNIEKEESERFEIARLQESNKVLLEAHALFIKTQELAKERAILREQEHELSQKEFRKMRDLATVVVVTCASLFLTRFCTIVGSCS